MMKDEPKRLYEASIRANNITTTGFELHSGYVGTTYPITFPTAFDNECSGVWPSIEHKTSVGGNEVFYHTNKSTAGFTLVADASHAPSTLDGVVYLAIGN